MRDPREIEKENRASDLEEATKLDAAAATLTGAAREEVEREAADLRARWQAPAVLVSLAETSASLRESDLAEADRLEGLARTLRAGAARTAVEADAIALRAKWPDFSDDPEGQVRRIGAFLLARGVKFEVPARAALERIAELEAQIAENVGKSKICFGCGLPQPGTGPGPVNAFLLAAVKMFETDADFRDQVTSGQVKPGQTTHPWIPGATPHKGPNSSTSPWAMGTMATMIRGDARIVAEVGPRLRAALAERSLSIPGASSIPGARGPQKPDAPRLN